MKVLLSAFACQPNRGTEPGNGWGYAAALAARGIIVHVLVTKDHQDEIEKELIKLPIPGLIFHYLNEGEFLQEKSLKVRYLAWQWLVLAAGRRLHRLESFDLAHHVTYGSIHVPTLLWMLNIPVIFGPVGGGQTAPKSMLGYFEDAQFSERLRTSLTKFLHYSPWHRYCLRKMAAVLVSNRDTEELCGRLGCKRIEFALDAVLPSTFLAATPRSYDRTEECLKLLWVGRLLPRKAIALTLDMIKSSQCPLQLTIVGSGIDESKLRTMISDRGLDKVVIWDNRRRPWGEVRDLYACYDALLFTSLRDSCAAQLLEAMACGLPVITLDLHGASDLVPAAAGLKIPVVHPEQVVSDGAKAIERFAKFSSKEWGDMSRAGWEHASSLTFGKRAEYVESVYRSLVR